MKTTQNNRRINQRPVAFRMPCLLALLVCAGVSAHASISSLLNQNLQAQQSLSQLSTGLKINSASDDLGLGNSAYSWLQVAPGVMSLSYNSLQTADQQQQQVLQLLRGDDPIQSGISQLAQANQQQQSLLQLNSGDNSQLVQAQTLQQSSVQSLQQLSVQSLSLANQQLQVADDSSSPVQSVLSLVQANQQNRLSTGLKINQAADPSQLVVSTQNGLVVQLDQNNDGYDNKLGLNAAGLSINNASLQALFPDDAASQKYLQTPLTAADFVTVGHLTQDQALSFFQMAQSINGQSVLRLFSDSDNAANLTIPGQGDQFSTSIIALRNLNSPYLFISIADQSGLDAQEYNSAVLAINIGEANVHALFAAPEPSMYLTLGGFLALGIWAKRRMDRMEATK